MPLPNIKQRCSATKRKSDQRCKNPAAFGCKTCRYHGARNILRGKDHPNYKHGKRTNKAIEAYRQKAMELDALESLGRSIGFISGPRRRGRKPKNDMMPRPVERNSLPVYLRKWTRTSTRYDYGRRSDEV